MSVVGQLTPNRSFQCGLKRAALSLSQVLPEHRTRVSTSCMCACVCEVCLCKECVLHMQYAHVWSTCTVSVSMCMDAVCVMCYIVCV